MTWSDLYALLPVLVLIFGSTVLLMAGAWRAAFSTMVAYGILFSLAAAATAVFHTPGSHDVAGFFLIGGYSRFFSILWPIVAALTLTISFRYGADRGFSGGEYAALILFACAGMVLLSSASSLVSLFLGLETFTLALYILIAFHKGSPLGAEAGLKYLVMGGVATGLLAFGIALIFAATGTFHISEVSILDASNGQFHAVTLFGWGMLLAGIGFKISLVPFHLWTPDVYQGAPSPVAGLLATGSKGAVFAALVFLLGNLQLSRTPLANLLWVLSAASMLIGTLCALRQNNLKRMLAYSSVVHMGYLLLALLAGGTSGHTAILFYLVAYAFVNLGAFAVVTVFSSCATEPQSYEDFKGAGYRQPLAAAALLVFVLSLAGIPPTAGFMGKFAIFYAAIETGYTGLALIGILSSLVSLYYYLRPVIIMYMSGDSNTPSFSMMASEKSVLILCLIATLILGVYPGPLFDVITGILP